MQDNVSDSVTLQICECYLSNASEESKASESEADFALEEEKKSESFEIETVGDVEEDSDDDLLMLISYDGHLAPKDTRKVAQQAPQSTQDNPNIL